MKKLVFKPGMDALRQIEIYIDNLCENLFINETYYGNLQISLNNLNDWLFDLGQSSSVKLTYVTDHKILRFIIEGIDNQVYKKMRTHNEQINSDINIVILKQLCDSILINDGMIILNFEIGALHNSIYKSRVILLNAYFKKVKINLLDV